MLAVSGWLGSGISFWWWLLEVLAQTLVGFILIAAFLTPLWAWLGRIYRKNTDPFTPGGAGDVTAPNGQPMHEYLKEAASE